MSEDKRQNLKAVADSVMYRTLCNESIYQIGAYDGSDTNYITVVPVRGNDPVFVRYSAKLNDISAADFDSRYGHMLESDFLIPKCIDISNQDIVTNAVQGLGRQVFDNILTLNNAKQSLGNVSLRDMNEYVIDQDDPESALTVRWGELGDGSILYTEMTHSPSDHMSMSYNVLLTRPDMKSSIATGTVVIDSKTDVPEEMLPAACRCLGEVLDDNIGTLVKTQDHLLTLMNSLGINNIIRDRTKLSDNSYQSDDIGRPVMSRNLGSLDAYRTNNVTRDRTELSNNDHQGDDIGTVGAVGQPAMSRSLGSLDDYLHAARAKKNEEMKGVTTFGTAPNRPGVLGPNTEKILNMSEEREQDGGIQLSEPSGPDVW